MLSQSFVPGCTEISSLSSKEGMVVFFYSIYSSSNRFPRDTLGKAGHPTYALIHSWIATRPAVCVSLVIRVAAPASAAPPQQRWKQKTGLCVCATCSRAEKERAKIPPKEKCWMFFENIEKCFFISIEGLSFCVVLTPPLMQLMEFCWSACALSQGN